jgi:hypothetical protein
MSTDSCRKEFGIPSGGDEFSNLIHKQHFRPLAILLYWFGVQKKRGFVFARLVPIEKASLLKRS